APTIAAPAEPMADRFDDAAAPRLLARAGRIALVHDWCPDFRGGERVLSELCRLTAARDIFTLFDFLPADIKEEHFHGATFHTSV
ncbi:hypothetical protein J8J40_31550, partial [Mycobacterium tuberculosis]|nr:hypothetical protein [Mycobacterium tuberculosis]